MDRTSTTPIDMPSDRLLQQRAEAVAVFKARVDPAGMTRPARADEERAFLKSIGARSVFTEIPDALRRA